MSRQSALPAERLHRICDPESLGYETTAELEVPETVVVGQDEAMSALAFGFSLQERGYNVFVLGLPGSGRLTFARRMAEQGARERPAPSDWCYVYAFDDPRRPRAVELPSGRALEFRDAMSEVVVDLRRAVPQALESDHVSDQRAQIVERHGARAGELMEAVERDLRDDEWVSLVGTPEAMTVVPARGGEPLTQTAYEALPDETREEVDEHVRKAARALLEAQRKARQVEREARLDVAQYHQEVAGEIVDQRLDSVRQQFDGVPSVLAYLDEAAQDIVHNAEAFMRSGPVGVFPTSEVEPADPGTSEFLKRYSVNPLITRRNGDGAPVVEESNPHLRALFGRTEGQMRLGVMVTDFTQITAGAAHRANGGFLLLRAEEVLSRPLVWPALKRMLRTGELRPVDAATEMGLFAMQSLEPDPIPADLTVALIGEPRTFYLLQQLDSEFDEVFKVKVDFAPDLNRNAQGESGYAQLIAAECRRRSLPPFDASAVARIIEEGSRLAEDQTKLTTRLRPVLDLVLEASHHAGGQEPVTALHVQAALDDQDLRRRRPERRLLELLERGVLAFDPTGEDVGQLYGIGLSWLGEATFGRPIRVMASAYLGRGGLIHIEREAKLTGRIHNKGFLVVSGYLGRYFARRRPLTLSATVSFDQTYEEVEGDSASAAELYALLSAIGEVPIRQGIAVTGAVNQEGIVLPVGGVTAKVEGFFKACVRMGLDGTQGVILPGRNRENLCLSEDVRAAVAGGRFHLWAIERVEEGWPILSGKDAGEPSPEGDYPGDTVHGAVQSRLHGWAEQWAEARRGLDGAGEDDPAR